MAIIETLYDILQQEYEKAPNHDLILLPGDFNSKIGTEMECRHIVGQHSLHQITSKNGVRLCYLAEMQNFIISIPRLSHKKIQEWTWKIPGRDECNHIDHVLALKK